MNEEPTIANHVHDAIGQVRRLQELVLCKRMFRGYSGVARAVSGTAALVGAAVLASPWVPDTVHAHMAGWLIVLAIGLVMNYAALIYWFVSDADVRRNVHMLKPALDAVPALAMGAVFTAALMLHESFDLLPGTWMILYGLAQVAYRQSMPAGIYQVGLCYLICGTGLLLMPQMQFMNPWPMGVCFFIGEWVGGIILSRVRHEKEE